MTDSNDRAHHRGSTLLLAVILLAVLSVIGVAAVALSSQERTNARIMTHRDQLVACAAAAQATFWRELNRFGPRYPGSGQPGFAITLPDGTTLASGHYRDRDADGNKLGDAAGVTLVDAWWRPSPCVGNAEEGYVDLTNRDAFFGSQGSCSLVVARCADAQGRELEMEFGVNVLFQ